MASIVAMAVGVPMAFGSEEAATSATVGNAAPAIDSVTITPDDDGATGGVQVYPVPAGTKTITVTADLSDANGYDDIASVTATISPAPANGASITMTAGTGSGTSITYTGTYNMQFYDNSTAYIVTVTVTDTDSLSDNTPTATFTYTDATSITVTDVGFGALGAGESSSGKYSTVTNKGNTDVTFADETPAGYDNDAADGLQWSDMTEQSTPSVDTIVDDQISTTWSAATSIDNGATSSDDVPFTLAVPAGTLSGSYAGTITFTPTGTP